MSKNQIAFVCQECGYESPQWLGKCPECGEWNSFKEFKTGGRVKGQGLRGIDPSTSLRMTTANPEPLSTVSQISYDRIATGFLEMDNVLGGGIVPGSVTLLAGDPGIGKSTLLLQLCLSLAGSQFTVHGSQKSSTNNDERITNNQTVLYISGEESKEQVAMRANRLNGDKFQAPNHKSQDSSADNLLLLSMTDTDAIVAAIQETRPAIVVIDSIQTVESENGGGLSGSVGQIRYASSQFIRLAKELNIPFILVGHVTKEGMVAGPMTLSHMVDTVLFLEGEKLTPTRVLRSFKNRFGPVDEVGIFLMDTSGMVEVKNPEQIFLTTAKKNIPGSVLVVIMEGTRPFLVEIQALVVYSKFPMPRRVASGIDNRRVELLLAVLQKHCRLPLENYDVFVNIAGGARVSDTAIDLGVCLAIYSSLKNVPIEKTVAIAEVGLLGELRKVPNLQKRIKEAKKMGYQTVISAEDFPSIQQALVLFGGKEIVDKEWEEEDKRHWKIKGRGKG